MKQNIPSCTQLHLGKSLISLTYTNSQSCLHISTDNYVEGANTLIGALQCPVLNKQVILTVENSVTYAMRSIKSSFYLKKFLLFQLSYVLLDVAVNELFPERLLTIAETSPFLAMAEQSA